MVAYHVTLHGQGYLVDLSKYVRGSHDPFAPKRASGALGVTDFVADEGLRISDWSGGEGHVQLDPDEPQRYRAGSSIDVFTEAGSLRLGPQVVNTAVGPGVAATAAMPFRGLLYVGFSNGEVHTWNGAALALAHATGKAGGVRSMAVYLGRLFVGNGTDGVVAEADSAGVWTAARFTVAGASGVRALATFYRQTAQYLYVGAEGTAATTQVGSAYWWDSATLSSKQYDFEQKSPRVALVLRNRLYFAVADTVNGRWGLYSVDDSGSGGIYRHHLLVEGGFVQAGAVWQETAYLTDSEGRIYSWDGVQLRLVRQLGSRSAPFSGLISLLPWRNALWAHAKDEGGVMTLWRYDGQAWSRPATGLAGTDAGGAIAVFGGQLHVGPTQTPPQLQATAATFRASGTQESGLFDGGLPNHAKVWRSVSLTHSALASGESVAVQYQLDGTGAWTVLGTSSTLAATSATFSFSGTVKSRQIGLRMVLAANAGAAASPIVYDLLLRYRPEVEARREWELPILTEGTPELPLVTLDGQPEPLTGPQLSAALWTAFAVEGPVQFTDLDGGTRSVWFQDLREEVAKISQREGYQLRSRARLLEA